MTRAAIFCVLLAPAFAQQPPSFEVASVKPNRTGERVYYGITGGGRLMGRNMPLKGWIEIAYKVRDFQVTGGPAWLASDGFDIDAKAANPAASSNEMFALLRSLLAERFHLRLRRETKEAPVYRLVIARGGLKMKPSADQTPWIGDYPNGLPAGIHAAGASPSVLAPGRLAGEALPLSLFAILLTDRLERPLENRTGLTGCYQIDLRYRPDKGSEAADPALPSLFTALQEQLGLRIQPARGPVEMLVVERAGRPTPN